MQTEATLWWGNEEKEGDDAWKRDRKFQNERRNRQLIYTKRNRVETKICI